MGGSNFYRYGLNDPIVNIDPLGTLPGPGCMYWMYKCIQTGKQCAKDLDKAAGGKDNPNHDSNLCQSQHTGWPDDAYKKVCFDGNYYCQKMIQSCGEGAVDPPFKRVPYGNSEQVGSAINDTSKSKLSPVTSGTVVCRNR